MHAMVSQHHIAVHVRVILEIDFIFMFIYSGLLHTKTRKIEIKWGKYCQHHFAMNSSQTNELKYSGKYL